MQIFKPHELRNHIRKYLPANPIIVEAGAFNGSDSIRMAQTWPQGHIHAFEPVPELFKTLQQRAAPYLNITCYPLALSNHNGTAPLYISEKPSKPGQVSQGNSLLPPKERLRYSTLRFPHTITVRTITLDTWAEKYHINRIDLLWLDMQGNELAVLQSSKSVIAAVTAIYTEVSFVEGYEGQPLMEDIMAWMHTHGFEKKGRDFSNTTDWFFGNMLFVKKNLLS